MTTVLLAATVSLFLCTQGTSNLARAESGSLMIHFEEVELPVFIKFISKATGRNFVFSDRIGGTVTVISPEPVTAEEAYAVFQSVLAVRGLTTIDDGVVTRVVPLKDARTAGAGVVSGSAPIGGFATRLLPLRHVTAEQVASAVGPLVSKEGAIVAYPATNTVIVTDTSGNLRRIGDVVRALDIPSHEESVKVIRLQNAEADELANQINQILDNRTRAGGGQGKDKPPLKSSKVVADERTNSLIVMASGKELQRIEQLARGLDTPVSSAGERLHVYRARHADAMRLVEVASGMIGGRQRAQARADGRAAGGPVTGFAQDVTISGDPATNSVIVSASAHDYRTIENLLRSLDVARAQVFVEAIVAEVSMNRAESLGFEFQTGADIGDGVAITRSNLDSLNAINAAAGANPLSLTGLIIAALSDREIELPNGDTIPAQQALFSALANDGEVEILSSPTLLTLDNEEAEILVGQNVPFVTGQSQDLANVQNIFTQVERRDVGIKLTITPQIADGDVVVLDVSEEVSAVVASAILDASQVGPTTTVRSAKTTVSVEDGHTAVIGGLISNTVRERQNKVPILGDIPLLGRLFRHESLTDEKVNLIVFLTPHIIRDSGDLARVSAHSRLKFDERTRGDEVPVADPDFEIDVREDWPAGRPDVVWPNTSGHNEPTTSY